MKIKDFGKLKNHGIMNVDVLTEILWNPMEIFKTLPTYKYAVIVLNRPIVLSNELVLPLWENASVTITVDGGNNRWFNYLGDKAKDTLEGKSKKYLPTLITGDMDSVLPNLLGQLKRINANIIYTMDQNETDFTKAMMELDKYLKHKHLQVNGVHVLSETSGRLDHIVSNINTLYKCVELLPNIPIFLISSTSLVWLLKPGKHKILIPEIILRNDNWCALMPFSSSDNCVTTTGLKWNLNNMCMKFGGLLSTSNKFDNSESVTVNTNIELIWCMSINAITGLTES